MQALAAMLNSLDLLGGTLMLMVLCIFSQTSYCVCKDPMPLRPAPSVLCRPGVSAECRRVVMAKLDASVCKLRCHVQTKKTEAKKELLSVKESGATLTHPAVLHPQPPEAAAVASQQANTNQRLPLTATGCSFS